MKGFFLFCLASSIKNNNKDVEFNSWCKEIGIDCPAAEVRTTPESVAGRGVFSTQDISSGEEVISIPHYAALTQDNAAGYFATLAQELEKCRTKQSFIKRVWNRIRRSPTQDKLTADDYWQAELSAYALEALETDHPWSTWISQWKRDDPFQNLVDMSTWGFDDEATAMAVSDFRKMAPEIPEYKIGAAVGIRLQELDKYSEKYKNKNVKTSVSMYSTLISRAIGLSDDVTAILPMHDMINHSTNPNLAMAFAVDGNFKLIALHDIPKGEELFLTYQDSTGKWDEDKATWLLVQWGIPSSPAETAQFSQVDEKASFALDESG